MIKEILESLSFDMGGIQGFRNTISRGYNFPYDAVPITGMGNVDAQASGGFRASTAGDRGNKVPHLHDEVPGIKEPKVKMGSIDIDFIKKEYEAEKNVDESKSLEGEDELSEEYYGNLVSFNKDSQSTNTIPGVGDSWSVYKFPHEEEDEYNQKRISRIEFNTASKPETMTPGLSKFYKNFSHESKKVNKNIINEIRNINFLNFVIRNIRKGVRNA